MACLREAPIDGRVGVVSCNEEGCLFRRFETGRSSTPLEDTPEADCVLQLRLRAGDSEDFVVAGPMEVPAESGGTEGEPVVDGPEQSPEVVGRVTKFYEYEDGVVFTARLAPGWTIERIEEGLKRFFWGGPDDFDFNEIATPESDLDRFGREHVIRRDSDGKLHLEQAVDSEDSDEEYEQWKRYMLRWMYEENDRVLRNEIAKLVQPGAMRREERD